MKKLENAEISGKEMLSLENENVLQHYIFSSTFLCWAEGHP